MPGGRGRSFARSCRCCRAMSGRAVRVAGTPSSTPSSPRPSAAILPSSPGSTRWRGGCLAAEAAMLVAGRAMRTIWLAAGQRPEAPIVEIIDQTRLPHALVIARLTGLDDAARAIRDMQVRGAPLIGATAAYGMALAIAEDPRDRAIDHAAEVLTATRPTAVNLAWGVAEVR